MNTFHFSTDWATSLLILASILLLILCFILFFVRRKREKTQPKVNSVSESVVRDQEEDQDPIEQSEKIPDEKPVQNILTEKVAQVEEIIPLPPVSIKRGTVKPDFRKPFCILRPSNDEAASISAWRPSGGFTVSSNGLAKGI